MKNTGNTAQAAHLKQRRKKKSYSCILVVLLLFVCHDQSVDAQILFFSNTELHYRVFPLYETRYAGEMSLSGYLRTYFGWPGREAG